MKHFSYNNLVIYLQNLPPAKISNPSHPNSLQKLAMLASSSVHALANCSKTFCSFWQYIFTDIRILQVPVPELYLVSTSGQITEKTTNALRDEVILWIYLWIEMYHSPHTQFIGHSKFNLETWLFPSSLYPCCNLHWL